MNDSKNSSNGLLVLKLKGATTQENVDLLLEHITPTAEALGVEPMVVPVGVDIELQMGSSALLERICVALEEIAQQGRAPDISEAQIAPQALNARYTPILPNDPVSDAMAQALRTPTGLNTR